MKTRVKIFNIPFDPLTSSEAISRIEDFVRSGRPHQIITVNAEFLLDSQRDDAFRALLGASALNTADGIGVLWAAKFFCLPLLSLPVLNVAQAIFQAVFCGMVVIFSPRSVRQVLPEKISGVELVWRICELAEQKNHSVYVLGGYENTSVLVAGKLKARFPGLKIAGQHGGSPAEPGLVEKLKACRPDILLVAFGPVRQEKWIAENLENLQIPVVIGLGGTFDYIAGKKPLAPHFLRYRGLEWAFRLITQPYRLFRVFNAVLVFASMAVRLKLVSQRPYRRTIALCLKNSQGEILICRRVLKRTLGKEDYWQLPHGGVEKGETDEQALRREMEEELGYGDFETQSEKKDIFTYDWPLSFTRDYHGKFRGQTVSVVYALIDDLQADLKIRVDQREFDNYKWVEFAELVDSVHPIQKEFVEAVLKNAPEDFFQKF